MSLDCHLSLKKNFHYTGDVGWYAGLVLGQSRAEVVENIVVQCGSGWCLVSVQCNILHLFQIKLWLRMMRCWRVESWTVSEHRRRWMMRSRRRRRTRWLRLRTLLGSSLSKWFPEILRWRGCDCGNGGHHSCGRHCCHHQGHSGAFRGKNNYNFFI